MGVTPTRVEFMHLPQWQQGLFYVLATASVVAMLLQFVPRWRLWRKGKPIDWKPRPLESVWRYAVAQRKVQGSRPRSGTPMHLALAWGFMALLLATTLLAINTYAPVKFHQGAYYLAYEVTFDLLGLGLVVGCVWALGRRLLARARRNPILGHEWKDWVTLGLLLALGVTGYGLEALRIANAPEPWDPWSPVGYALAQLLPRIEPGLYVAGWWFHAVLVFGFFAWLPNARLKHILLGTLSAAGSPERPMARLEPVSLQEVEETGRLGVAQAADLSRWHLLSLDACMSCGRCTEVCPAYAVGKPLDPRKVVQDTLAASIADETIPVRVTPEALWACTTCSACVEACPVLIRHTDVIVGARRHLVGEGALSGSAATMLRQVGGSGHAWGAKAGVREDWMAGLDVPLARDGAEYDVLLWVGCAGATDPGAVKTTKALARLLTKAGVRFACLGKEERCTGDPARRAGDEFTFQEAAEKNVATMRKYGVRRIVTACPHCMNTFRHEYRDFGLDVQAEHHTELLARLVDEGRLEPARAKPGAVTYHDPCYLARANGVSDAPRKLLGAETSLDTELAPLAHALTRPNDLNPLAEPEHRGRKTLCCGAGGARLWMDEPPEQRPAGRRAAELRATGATTVAVGCPFCRIMLGAEMSDLPMKDVAEALWEANA